MSARRKLLVADDDPGVLDLFERILPGTWGMLRARSGGQAVEIFWRHQPAVVFLDLRMPMGGLEVLRTLRRHPRGSTVPIYLFSSESEIEARRRALAAGAQGFLPKPVTREALGKVLRRLEPSVEEP